MFALPSAKLLMATGDFESFTRDVRMPEMSNDAVLEAKVREAASEWPQIQLEPGVLLAYVRSRLARDEGQGAVDVASLHMADLHLTCACVRGDPVAWRELDRRYLSNVREYVGRVDANPAFVDEVRQRLAERLLPKDSEEPRLALYSGRGPIGAWLRIAAIRVARDLKRAVRKTEDIDGLPNLAADLKDVEIVFLKRQFAGVFSEIFREVLGTLSTDERNVLRLHYLDGLTIEETGRTYGVSRATAARWLASARTTILERTRAALADRAESSSASPASILAFVRSELRMSLRRHLE